MKKKLPKKILAAFLAVMMVATSIPFSAITAFAATGYVDAATDEKVIAVENAMDAFKSKLSEEGKSYSNVSPAYAAYVNCQQGLDAYIYGGEDNALDGLADALNTAVNNMQEFNGIEANTDRYRTVQIYSADSTGYSAEEYAQTYANLLWSETGVGSANDGKQTASDGYSSVTLYYPEVTLMYDGKTDPVTSMMAVAAGEGSWAWNGDTRYISAITMENSSDTGFVFNKNWHGTSGNNLDFNWAWITNGKDNNDQYNLSYNQTDAGSVYQVRKGGTAGLYKKYQKYFANLLTFTDGDTKFGDNRWKIDVQPQLKAHIGSSTDFIQNINNASSVSVDGTTYIHIVNYKQVIDNVKTAGAKMKNTDLANYTQGGLTSYFTAMDAATSFDPNNYFKDSNDVDGYCSAASNVVKNVKQAKTTDTNETVASGFQAIRDAMGSQLRQTYANGGDKYTADSWQNFVTAYEAARNEMAAANDTKLSNDLSNVKNIYYYDSQAKDYTTTVANALLEAYNALKTNVAKVDTTELVAYINKFQSYQPDFFTEETYNEVSKAVKEIKVDVWGSEEMWGVPASAPDDDAEGVGKAKVAAAIEKYKAAFADLRISSAGVVLTTQGRYSLDEAIALESKIADPTDYSNYADFATLLADAKNYKENLASTEMTDYDAQYEEYTNTVDALVKAYNGLLYSFTKIPDGTVYGNTESDNIQRITIKDQGSTFIEGSYTNQGIVFRTDHTAKQVKFGDFNVTYGTTTHSYKDNALDSISINATAPKLGDNGSKAHITNNGGGIGTVKPKGLSDEQRATYAGCLSYSNKNDEDKPFTFSVSNLRYTGRNGSNVCDVIITKNDGTQVKDHATATQTPLDEILGTTNGQEVTPMVGGVFAQSDGNDDEAYSYIKGDFNIDIPATEKQTLTRDTVPTLSTFEMQTRFGAVGSYKCQSFNIWAGYNWFTSEMTDTYLTPAVKVVDISSLVELVAECNALTKDSQKYTDESWAKFAAALKNAQNNINYTNMTSSDSVRTLVNTILKTRYQTLWDARANLVVKTLTVNVKYGKDLTSLDPAIKVTYGEKISAADIARINAILKETYEADGYTWIPNGFTTTFDPEAVVTEDIDLTVNYEKGDALPASWDAYNSAKAALIAKLEGTDKFAYDALTNVKNELAKLTFFTLADNEKSAYTSESQSAIDAETATITSLTNNLTAISLTSDVLQVAAAAQAAQGKDDTDMYDNVASKIDYKGNVTFDMITKDASSSALTVTGYKYSTDSALEAAIKAALNGLELKTYDIYVNNTYIGTVAYGTPVSVTPTKIISTTDTTVKGDGANYSWTYSYTAPSRDPNFGTSSQDNSTYLSAKKFMLTAPSLGFIVKGETHLTATQVSTGKTGYTVTFKSSVNGKVINVINTDANGNFKMPAAPSVPYYTFDSYSNGVAANADATVSQDTVITVNYTADEENLYTFYVYNNPNDFLGTTPSEVWDTENSQGVENAHDSVAYNELVNVNIPDSYAIAKAVYDEDSGEYWYYILAYGDTYSFYAHESIGDNTLYVGIVGITEEQYKKMQEPKNDIGYVYGTDGERIVAEQNTLTGAYETKDLEFEVYNRETPVFAADNSKFSLIGTFICPTGYQMVETGFLMTKGDSSLTVENAADKSKGVSRFKASKYTVGNQFVINIKTPSTEQSFKYVAYAKYKDKSGNIVTKYGKVISATTANS